jgi:protocatechuate 3,4-dioxygenase beta subunit
MSRSARRLAVFGLAGSLLAVWAWNDGTKVVPESHSGDTATREARPADADAGDVQLAASARRVVPTARGAATVRTAVLDEDGSNMYVSGRVLDETGRPVAGAEIRGEMGDDSGLHPTPPVATAADGSFTVRIVNDDCATITVTHPAFRPWTGTWSARHEAVVRLVREDRSRVRFRFTGHVPLDGQVRVLAERGGARPNSRSEEGVRCVVRGGVAELPEPLVPDTWTFLVLADAGASGFETLRVTAGPGVLEVPFELRPKRQLRVRVVDASGAPAGDVKVYLNGPESIRNPWRGMPDDEATTSADGVAQLECVDLPPLTVHIAGFRDGVQVVQPGADEIRFVALPLLRITGRVNGLPVPDETGAVPRSLFSGGYGEQNPLDPDAPWVECRGEGDLASHLVGWTIAARDGRFVLNLSDRTIPDRVRVRAFAGPRYGPWTEVTLDERNPDREVEVASPPRAETLEGVVRDSDGRPFPNVCVEIEAELSNERRWFGAARTDAEGRFVVRGVSEGEWALRASLCEGVRSAPIRARTGVGPVALVLSRPGKLSGTLVSQWRPLPPGWDVIALSEGEGGLLSARTGGMSSSDDFTIGGVQPGRIRLFVRAGHEAGVSAPFDLAPGGSADAGAIRLEPGAVLEGRTISRSGAPRANLSLVVCDPRSDYRRAVSTDLLGRFRVEGLWEGRWTVGAAPLADPEEGTAVVVEMGHTHEVTVTVP